MTDLIGFDKPAFARQRCPQVLDRIDFFRAGGTNTSPEFKGIKTAATRAVTAATEQIPGAAVFYSDGSPKQA